MALAAATCPRQNPAAAVPALLEHFPEKWAPVFRRKCEKIKNLERFPIQLNRKAL
jgi:hypothetical protein